MDTQTADRILKCAHALIVERGYNGFSYADIAKTMDITKASIHYHYPTKAALGKEVVGQYREVVTKSLDSVERAGINPIQKIQRYFAYWVGCIRDRTMPFCICALLAAEISALPEEIQDEVRGHFHDLSGWLTGVLSEGVSQGHFTLTQSAAKEADSLMAAVHGGMLAARAMNRPELFESITSAALSRLLR